jgi:antitoxin component YwqK of YwqJK toxin-antitoxin module
MYGEAYVELIDGSNFHGVFNNGKSDVGIYKFKFNNVYTSIKASLDLSDDKNIRITVQPNTELIVSNCKYIGDFKFNITGNYENFNIRFILNNGKHYIDNIINYEGEFKNFKQHGQGMRYYPTGSVHMIGKFNEGEISKCEYYDESGNLIYSDFTES